jgi:hypothetical protein
MVKTPFQLEVVIFFRNKKAVPVGTTYFLASSFRSIANGGCSNHP